MLGQYFRFVVLSTFVCVIWASPTSNSKSGWGYESDGTENATFIGSADGKSYFVKDSAMNWTNAQKYCISSGWKLASIERRSQFNIWASAFKNVRHQWHHWTAGRDAMSLSQFVWDNDNSLPNPNVVKLQSPPDLSVCLSFMSWELHGRLPVHYFHAHSCSFEFPVICELKN